MGVGGADSRDFGGRIGDAEHAAGISRRGRRGLFPQPEHRVCSRDSWSLRPSPVAPRIRRGCPCRTRSRSERLWAPYLEFSCRRLTETLQHVRGSARPLERVHHGVQATVRVSECDPDSGVRPERLWPAVSPALGQIRYCSAALRYLPRPAGDSAAPLERVYHGVHAMLRAGDRQANALFGRTRLRLAVITTCGGECGTPQSQRLLAALGAGTPSTLPFTVTEEATALSGYALPRGRLEAKSHQDPRQARTAVVP